MISVILPANMQFGSAKQCTQYSGLRSSKIFEQAFSKTLIFQSNKIKIGARILELEPSLGSDLTFLAKWILFERILDFSDLG
jgi:hypothetical protein